MKDVNRDEFLNAAKNLRFFGSFHKIHSFPRYFAWKLSIERNCIGDIIKRMNTYQVLLT